MKYDFAALRFSDDVNLKDRLYWYLADFDVCEGEEVLAPVGVHDKLQKAVVERVACADETAAPYDVRLAKRIAAKFGARKLEAGGITCIEFGGVKYDDRHYTRFARILYADSLPKNTEELNAYGVTKVFEAPMSGDDAVYRAVMGGHGVLLVGGEGRKIMRTLFALLKGERDAEPTLYACGLCESELEAIKSKLG